MAHQRLEIKTLLLLLSSWFHCATTKLFAYGHRAEINMKYLLRNTHALTHTVGYLVLGKGVSAVFTIRLQFLVSY